MWFVLRRPFGMEYHMRRTAQGRRHEKVQIVPTLETERLILRMWNKKTQQTSLLMRRTLTSVLSPAGNHMPVRRVEIHNSQRFPAEDVMGHSGQGHRKACRKYQLRRRQIQTGDEQQRAGLFPLEDFWGRGIMTEAAERVIRYAFETLALDSWL